MAGFLHPEGAYDDPKGGGFRRELYPRLRAHFQFINETKLFAEVHNQTLFSINIHGPISAPRFDHVSNFFVPVILDTSFAHEGEGEVPGIKEEVEQPDGRVKVHWNFEGHRDRFVEVGEQELELFAKLYDAAGTDALEARLPALHARQLIGVLEKFAAQPKRLGDLEGDDISLEMWHETNTQGDGTIRRETRFPNSAADWVLSGPHFFVGNPLFKSPRAGCKSNKDYDALDLERLPDDTQPGGPREIRVTYQAPYFRPDREQDYRRAWAFLAEGRVLYSARCCGHTACMAVRAERDVQAEVYYGLEDGRYRPKAAMPEKGACAFICFM